MTAEPGRRGAKFLGWSAAACIGTAILFMILVSAAAPSQAVPRMPRPAGGPPWWPLSLRLTVVQVYACTWGAAIIGFAGVVLGLAAVARGARPKPRLLIAAAAVAVAALAVLPPAGSTDTLNYATYGRMVTIGHSPYVMTPQQLRHTGDPIGRAAPVSWQKQVSVYGPVSSAEEWAAAELGGTSMARIVFWLKLWNALAFGAVVAGLDRLLRGDPVRRARAHLIWSVNPLLLWGLVAGGHVDGLATALGFFGLAVATVPRPGGALSPPRAFAAGLLVGAAADVKITFGLFALAILWAARRSAAAVAGAVAGLVAVLAPSFLVAGGHAVAALANRSGGATWDNLYQLGYTPLGYSWHAEPGVALIATVLFAVVAALALIGLPDGFPSRPAVQPALALSLAWLLVWPYQRPWYDAMALCLLALYPASALDWLLLLRLLVATTVFMPGITRPGPHDPQWLARVFQDNGSLVSPAIRLAALAAVVVILLRGAWGRRSALAPGGPAMAGGP